MQGLAELTLLATTEQAVNLFTWELRLSVTSAWLLTLVWGWKATVCPDSPLSRLRSKREADRKRLEDQIIPEK